MMALSVSMHRVSPRGIWLLWKTVEVFVSPISLHEQHIIVEVTRQSETPWVLFTIYASPNPTTRYELWLALAEFARLNNKPWLMADDFNATLSSNERFGSSTGLSTLGRWVALLLHSKGPALIGLFAIMIGTSGFLTLVSATYLHLDRPFRFQAAWLSHDNFASFLSESWHQDLNLHDSLSLLAKKLGHWNRRVLAIFSPEREIFANNSRISNLELVLGRARKGPSRKALGGSPPRITSLASFLVDGDRNTRHYHLSTVVADVDALKDMVCDIFVALYSVDTTNPKVFTNPLPIVDFPSLLADQVASLLARFSRVDVWESFRAINPYKSPNPNGFHAIFYQKNWGVVDPKVIESVLSLLNQGILEEGFADAFMVLHKKVDNPSQQANLMPISLLNLAFKIATKAIVNRLKQVLPLFMSPSQTAFIPGRQIIDNMVIVQEALHSMNASPSSHWMILKVDLAKVYDRVKWEFLRSVLHQAGLPTHLVEVIMLFQTRGAMNILWNGAQAHSLMPLRGIRQGDPLSPYLFVLCMVRLFLIIQGAVECGHWNPVTIGNVQLLHLFFVDDLVLFPQADAR
ncbi:hypothetical protein V2J09_016668 [Rumex salicifolius]